MDISRLFSVSGKNALITGGATGVGAMIAEALVSGGAKVFIASRKGEACEAAAAHLNSLGLEGSAEGFAGDVGNEEAILALAAEVGKRTDKLHILVNNAGISWGAPFADFPHEQWNRVFNVNVAAPFTLTRELYPLLRAAASPADPARVLNIGSIMGTAPVAEGAYSYTMSKAAVHHLTRTLAVEFASDHVTVNALAPGPFPSKMTRFALGHDKGREAVAGHVPLGRVGEPEDIAGAVLYLCSRAGAYISGAILPVDGGMSALSGVTLFEGAY
jgi:NAD(P)-dependent dehydrogenase (short-subunit alcohol dehydrogenase family)